MWERQEDVAALVKCVKCFPPAPVNQNSLFATLFSALFVTVSPSAFPLLFFYTDCEIFLKVHDRKKQAKKNKKKTPQKNSGANKKASKSQIKDFSPPVDYPAAPAVITVLACHAKFMPSISYVL